MFLIRLYLFQAWITLGRAQLNFGEPDIAIKSFDRALAIKVKNINTLSVTVIFHFHLGSYCVWVTDLKFEHVIL